MKIYIVVLRFFFKFFLMEYGYFMVLKRYLRFYKSFDVN